jgi:hypothetical protein
VVGIVAAHSNKRRPARKPTLVERSARLFRPQIAGERAGGA